MLTLCEWSVILVSAATATVTTVTGVAPGLTEAAMAVVVDEVGVRSRVGSASVSHVVGLTMIGTTAGVRAGIWSACSPIASVATSVATIILPLPALGTFVSSAMVPSVGTVALFASTIGPVSAEYAVLIGWSIEVSIRVGLGTGSGSVGLVVTVGVTADVVGSCVGHAAIVAVGAVIVSAVASGRLTSCCVDCVRVVIDLSELG